MKHGLSFAALAAVAVACAAPSAHAQEPGDLAIGGELLLTLRDSGRQSSVDDRVGILYDRLRYILADTDLRASDIRRVGSSVMVKNRLLVTVTAADGEVNKTPASVLAQEWTMRLQKQLPILKSRPDLTLQMVLNDKNWMGTSEATLTSQQP
jgi:hypothetical protein